MTRQKPLKSYKPLKRKTPIARVSKNKEKRNRNKITTKVRTIVKIRSGGQCEAVELVKHEDQYGYTMIHLRCWRRADDMHHVLPLSRGGKSTPENLKHLCRFPHHAMCKDQPLKAKELGLLL